MQSLDIRNELGNTALHDALKQRDHDRCRALLEQGANCHMRDLYGQTPLHMAIQNGDLALAGLLVEHGANVNERNCDDMPALYTAARLGNLSLVRWLCEHGADVNLEQHENWSVLHEAAASGSLEVVRYLVEERQVELRGHCPDGSPFMYAVQSGNLELVRHFVEHLQADANEKRPFNLETPLHYAVGTGRLDLVRYLVEECGARSESSTFGRQTPLDHALECGHSEITEYLSATREHCKRGAAPYVPMPTTVVELPKSGSDPSKRPSFGRTALHDAVLTSSVEGVLALLDEGLDVNACDDAGTTALLLAAERNDEAMVEALLRRGAATDIRDQRSGKTLLHVCAEMRHFGVLRQLLDAGASPFFRSADGELVLHALAEAGNAALLDALITHGMPVDEEGRPNHYAIGHAAWNRQAESLEPLLRGELQNPDPASKKTILQHQRWLLDLASQHRRLELVRLIVEYDAELHGPGALLHRAAREGRSAHVRAILDATNLSIDLPDERGRTILFHAVDRGDLAFIRELAQRGASFSVADTETGARPIERAAVRNRRELLPFLLEATPDLNRQAQNGLRFIHYLISQADTTAELRLAVQKGADPSLPTGDGSTLLHLAACKNAPPVVCRFLREELHLDIDQPNDAGMTPLGYAMQRRLFDLVESWLDGRVSMRLDPSAYRKTLFRAIEAKHWGAFFKMLLFIRCEAPDSRVYEAADLVREARDHQAATFLHRAARQGNLAAVQRLVELKADVNARADFEKTVLLDAAESGSLDVVRFLVDHGADVHARNQHGKTILHLAAFYPDRYDLSVLALLVERGLDVDARTAKQDTALHFAIENRNLPLVRFLIAHQAFTGIRGANGETPFLFAAKRNETEIVRMLVEAGCDVNEQSTAQRTALHFAAQHGAFDLVEFLLAHGADPNIQDQAGTTALHLAAKDATEARVQMLLDHGADPLARDKRGQTPWSMSSDRPWHGRLAEMAADAVKRNPAKTVFRLLDADTVPVEVLRRVESPAGFDLRDAEGCPLLLSLIRRNRRQSVHYLLERGVAPDRSDGHGETPLHAAARRGDTETARLLVERGADVNARDRFGTTVLHEAARGGSLELVRHLVETCQADVHARDARGRGVCLAPAEKQHWEVVKYLVEGGVDAAGAGDFGRTVLHFAGVWQQPKVFDWLVQHGADVEAKDRYGKTPAEYLSATTPPARSESPRSEA